MDKIFKVGLVGCGTISANHIRALLDVPYVKIVALCDKIAEKAEKGRSNSDLTQPFTTVTSKCLRQRSSTRFTLPLRIIFTLQ